MQLIHVRIYGTSLKSPFPLLTLLTIHLPRHTAGESEYWFAMIKVLLIVIFIIVGLIYDWGGVIGHPGPVRTLLSHLTPKPPTHPLTYSHTPSPSSAFPGPLKLAQQPSLHRRLLHLRPNIRLRLLLLRRRRTRLARRRRVEKAAQDDPESRASDVPADYHFLCSCDFGDWVVYQLAG